MNRDVFPVFLPVFGIGFGVAMSSCYQDPPHYDMDPQTDSSANLKVKKGIDLEKRVSRFYHVCLDGYPYYVVETENVRSISFSGSELEPRGHSASYS